MQLEVIGLAVVEFLYRSIKFYKNVSQAVQETEVCEKQERDDEKK